MTRLPTYTGAERRRALVALWGLPNSAPTEGELLKWGPLAYLRTRRCVFVDDNHEGEPVAFWQPEEPEP